MNTSAQFGGQSFEIPPDECRELLDAGLVGRVAVSTPMGPHIVPVNYAVVDDCIVLRTSPYSVLGSHARGAILALEPTSSTTRVTAAGAWSLAAGPMR
jgi:hypothetical protein